MPALLIEESPKRGHVFVQFAVHHEGAVIGQQVRHRRHRQFASFVGISQNEFARSQRNPLAILRQFALAGLAVPLRAVEIGIAEAIGVAEMLLGARLAIDENRLGILRLQQTRAAGLLHDALHFRAAFIEGLGRQRVDPQPDVHHILAPNLVPVLAGVAAGVA